ncbi:MAG: chalcone isomerase family protein [Spirochaetes bacterium]|nr:chalcone isomerase family protein [Spirochaetota bacterium]
MKRLYAVVLAMAVGFAVADAKTVKDVTIPDSYNAAGKTLVLNGTGIRTKFGFDIYIGALYLKAKGSDGAAIAAADEPMCVRLHIVSRLITPKRMEDNTREGFRKSTGGKDAPFREGIDKFINTFKDGIAVGDRFDIAYLPGRGVRVYKNGALKSSVEGLAFKKALFGIWIGPNSIQEALRDGMLGR